MTGRYRPSVLAVHCLLALAASAAADTGETFERQPGRFRVGPNPCYLVAPDLNGDGRPEIVSADRGPLGSLKSERPANNELSLLTSSDADPLGYEKAPFPRSGFAPYYIAVANVDALPLPDLIVANFHAASRHEKGPRHFTLFRNLQNLQFEPVDFHVPEKPLDPSDPEGGLAYFRHRDNDGTAIFSKPGLTSLVVYDADGDGYRDLIATGWSSDVIVVVKGHPEDYFVEEVHTIPAPGGPFDVASADFDGDGEGDLVTTMYASGEIVLWKGDAQGGFAEEVRFNSRGLVPHRVRVADVNEDGKVDLIVSHRGPGDQIVIFFGQGGFDFSTSQDILLGDDRAVTEHDIFDIVVRDFTGDERPDIAVACYESKQVELLLNTTEKGAIPAHFDRETYSYKNGRPRALCTADFNDDGKMDLAVGLWETNAVALLTGR